jgi:pimeloyl-ACP methyl ester carboxylesterase
MVRSMAEYVQLEPVRTWYAEAGVGDPLVLLRPGLADARAFGPNLPALADRFRVLTPERRGHGHSPDVPGPITFEAMAADTIRFIEQVVGGPVRLAGCSDGAIVALLVALERPDLIERLACIAGPFHRDGWIPEAIDPTNQPPEFMAAATGRCHRTGPSTSRWSWTSSLGRTWRAPRWTSRSWPGLSAERW